MNNRLKQFVALAVAKKNKNKKGREKKHSIMAELRWVAAQMDVSFNTVWAWYINRNQPESDRQIPLARLYKSTMDKFYYQKVKIKLLQKR